MFLTVYLFRWAATEGEVVVMEEEEVGVVMEPTVGVGGTVAGGTKIQDIR